MFQQTTVVGYVGNAPELKFAADGKPVATFSVASSKRNKAGLEFTTRIGG